ncbi:GOLPH3/VPS74 family protein [Pseudonocardia endophytica]|uniref:Golgi phosphoprotein 3 GPP34 n=1 Tax=Pseudonocardia endophytica TaxID=401976 RepID=A0A4R1HMR8_PSEEN|nr:GPP34 family phosphoprotein [Pseudonocardia endophytica]TCK20959.1 Golgi phosphoprotein 3 GPP34 [Pseudonocardia endophytica]
MGDLLLCEELLLLGLDDESGKPSWTFDASMLNAALMLDLVTTGCVRFDEDKVYVTEHFPRHPLMAAAQDVIADDKKVRSISHWHTMLPYTLKDLQKRAAERLVADGVLVQEESKVLGLFRSTRFPESDPGPERALRARLHSILVENAEPDDHDTALITLLASGYGIDHVFSGDDKDARKAAKRRAKELSTAAKEDPVFQARHDAAVIAAVTMVATTTVITTTGNGS